MSKPQSGLVRVLGLGALIIYGIGDILGAGIYSIVGKIAGHAGSLTWLSFAIAMAIVLLTALSYSELSSRFPQSGGVSVYIQEAFGQKWMSIFAGLLLFSATIFSMSTLSQAFVGYLGTFGFKIPKWLGVLFFFSLLLSINIRGIRQSSVANIISTFIELSGLLIVLFCGFWFLSTTDSQAVSTTSEEFPGIGNVLKGAALAFFAFTGFEDLANVAEEVKEPEKNLPRAILSSLGVAGILYLGVSWTATAIIPGSELGQSEAPLFDVVTKSYPAIPTYLFAIIALFAVSNTTLLNYITASRLLYGMSRENLMPKLFQTVHSKYHTPYVAILLIFPMVLLLSFVGNLSELASATSTIVLMIFSFSNIALIKIKLRERGKLQDDKAFHVSIIIPCLALALNILAITFLPLRNIIQATVFVAISLLVTWVVLKAEIKLNKLEE
ncbi:amino acid transporter [Legionella beliardensis]|uniref:Amino acid transporter n=1 Tax=Legionella beliardensis TaxID=91822 RepID=A0A378IAP3_9GAMM|nr:APC family permease [Legionella beliardensis]STX29394.1 amino acid transporter [Legionella beliardensis]